MKDFKVIVKIDVNDGDYMEKSWDVSEVEVNLMRTMLAKFDKKRSVRLEDYEILPKIKTAHPSLSENDWEWFKDFMPSGGDISYGYATLESVIVLPIAVEERLF